MARVLNILIYMKKLLAIAYPTEKKAQNVLEELTDTESEPVSDLDDAVIATRKQDGKVRIRQTLNLTGMGALQGALWGSVIGFILTGPLGLVLAGAGGAGFGALTGKLSDYNIDNSFVKELGQYLKPGTSALFVMTTDVSDQKLISFFEDTGGKVMVSSLSDESEKAIRELMKSNNSDQ